MQLALTYIRHYIMLNKLFLIVLTFVLGNGFLFSQEENTKKRIEIIKTVSKENNEKENLLSHIEAINIKLEVLKSNSVDYKKAVDSGEVLKLQNLKKELEIEVSKLEQNK